MSYQAISLSTLKLGETPMKTKTILNALCILMFIGMAKEVNA